MEKLKKVYRKVYIVNCVAEKDTWVQKVFADPNNAQKYALRLTAIAKELKCRCPEWSEGGNNDDYYFHWQRWHFWMLLKDVYVIDFDIN